MAVRTLGSSTFHRKRVSIAFTITLLCYLQLVAKLLYLQGVEGDRLSVLSAKARKKTENPMPSRGVILDNAGNPLANNIYSGEIHFDPSAIAAQKNLAGEKKEKLLTWLDKSMSSAASILQMPEEQIAAKILKGCNQFQENIAKHPELLKPAAHAVYPPENMDTLRGTDTSKTLYKACIEANREIPFQYVLIKKDIDLEISEAIRLSPTHLLGFSINNGSKRMYPTGKNTAQLVGFMSSTGNGVSGLEKSLNSIIKGKSGEITVEKDNHGRVIPDTSQIVTQVEDGSNIHTTIDSTAQSIATDAAQKLLEKYNPKGVSIVIIDPATGDVKAMVSAPTFDPNPGQHSDISVEAQWERCSTMLFDPGSTLKAVTICGAYDSGDINDNSAFYCPGSLRVSNKTIRCVLHGNDIHTGHGTLTARGILRQSCNVGAAEIGMRMGPSKLYETEANFGILSKLDISIPNEQSGRLYFDQHVSRISSNSTIFDAATGSYAYPKHSPIEKILNERNRHMEIFTAANAARVAFGQSIVTTPMHVALAYGAIANKGILMKPRLISSLTTGNGTVIKSWEPIRAGRATQENTAEKVRAMLCGVVSEGTGKVAAIPGYQIAGKTGTATKDHGQGYYASFVGFLPASPKFVPRAVILVGVDEPKNGHFGAEVAAPAFHDIAMRMMQVWHVPQDDPASSQYKIATMKAHSKSNNQVAMHIIARH